MTTQWDDDRLVATVKARGNKSPITGLEEVGFIVQVHDHGTADGRAAKPTLMFDSEGVHGTAGVFHDDATAQVFADRRLAGMLRQQREIEAERHRRKEDLSARQRELWAEEHRQKEIAKEANKAAKEAEATARKLAAEAEDPAISLSCNPAEDGWSLWVAPCWTNGTQDGDPSQLVIEGLGMLGPQRLVDSEGRSDVKPTKTKRPGRDPAADRAAFDAPAEPKSKSRRGRTKPPAVHVPDAAGLPLKIGSKVELQDEHGHGYTAEVIAVLGQDPKTDQWRITVEDTTTGVPADVYAGECTRLDLPTEPDDEDD